MRADKKAKRAFMEQKKNKLLNDMIQNDTDRKMVQLVEEATDLSCGARQTHERSSGINSAFCYFLSF